MAKAPLDLSNVNQSLYPSPSKKTLTDLFVNQSLSVLPTPSAILDLAVVKKNCDRILQTCEALELSFRGHIKTHKTIELTRYQLLGSSLSPSRTGSGRVCVSTIAEAEGLIPLIEEGTVTDVLYAFPVSPSAFLRLLKLVKVPFPKVQVSVLVDNYQQLSSSWTHLEALPTGEGTDNTLSYGIFIKLDSGYGRAGVHPTETHSLQNMIELARNLQGSGIAQFRGLYTHAGHSYAGSKPDDALWALAEEIKCALDALTYDSDGIQHDDAVTISIGASPTALVLGNLLETSEEISSNISYAYLRQMLMQAKELKRVEVEIHAGVYTILDLQQIATNVISVPQTIGLDEIALTILGEVASVYPRRSEALVNVGTLGIGREPGPGHSLENLWGLVSNWIEPQGCEDGLGESKLLEDGGWVLKRLSQEHGILAWKQNVEDRLSLRIGQKVRIIPQHACIAGAGHGWYFVVDSDKPDGGNIVHDVWIRSRGW